MSYPTLFPTGPTGTMAQGLAASPGPTPADASAGTPAANASGGGSAPASFADAIQAAAAATGVDPRLLTAVAEQESGMNPDAVSPAGAEGLMQLMPGTAQSLGVQDAFDPAQNALGGAEYLKEMLAKFQGDVPLALAAYNAGPGAVEEYGGIPPYAETEAYVRGVLQDYQSSGG